MRYVLATTLSEDNKAIDVVDKAYYIYNPLSYRNILVTTIDHKLQFTKISTGEQVLGDDYTLLHRNIFNANNGGCSSDNNNIGPDIWVYDLDKMPEKQKYFNRDKMEWHQILALEEFLSIHNGVR